MEIGTFIGHTTKLLAMNLPEAIIHSVDLPLDFILEQEKVAAATKDDFHLIARREVGREYRGSSYEARIRQHFVDTAAWNFKEAAGATFIFIDGDHSYEGVKTDFELCAPFLSPNAPVLFHDSAWEHYSNHVSAREGCGR